ncbi:MAG: polysaccharide deacetylase family protein [Bacteroidota bacterium]|nr:polysaccharide deacetylase family protein [Bacteroidota bacterium]
MFKYRIPSFIQKLFYSYTWKVKTSDKLLFLTFDDGPHPEITPWVLAQLKQYNAKATFFCVADNVRKYPQIYAQIIQEGHSVGNHTYHHKNGWHTQSAAYLADVALAEKYIQSNLFRPPYGKIKNAQARFLLNQYAIVMWSHLSCDYSKSLNLQESLLAMRNIQAGSILVFHDSEKAWPNLQQLLPQLLPYYAQNGFEMKALSKEICEWK